MSDNGNGRKSITEYFRWLTPILITVGVFLLGNIQSTVKGIDDKLFKHLTNDEIHTPKSVVVTRPEFNIYQEMRNKEMENLRLGICEIKDMLKAKK
jgi:hypothetical protein